MEIFQRLANTFQTMASTKQMRFEDVEKSFKTFNGDRSGNIKKWITQFSDQADLLELNEFQRFVYAKRLMRETAKLFIDHESKAKSWPELKAELTKEFGSRVNAAGIHRKLGEKRKKKEETVTQYLYDMMALASQADFDDTALIAYVVDGLPGSMELKASLYEASTVTELKKKLLIYENQLTKFWGAKSKDFKPKTTTKEDKNGCYECGDTTHKKYQCPKINSQFKCFKCGEVGHLSRNCPVKESKEPKETKKKVALNGLTLRQENG